MAKACLKKDLKSLGNDIDDLIMLEDSARGTLCAIHKSIHSTDTFPCSRHKMLRLCPCPRSNELPCSRIPRFRKISRLNSPTRKCRAFSANQPCKRVCCANPHSFCRSSGSRVDEQQNKTSRFGNIEKTFSCPEEMCCRKTTSNRTCNITSRSSIHMDQFAQSLICTDEAVIELKSEIERVKHQLHNISQQKLSEPAKKTSTISRIANGKNEEPDSQVIYKLKCENKRLKREIEAKRKLLERSKKDVEKAKEILLDYEKKVGLLHVQALKSSKAMKISKEKFCCCLKEREEKIKNLKDTNHLLMTTIDEKNGLLDNKDNEVSKLKESLDCLTKGYEETCERCSVLSETNQNFYESIEMLRQQLQTSAAEVDSHKETIRNMEQKLSDLNCICKKVTTKTIKQKEMFEKQFKKHNEEKRHLAKTISELSGRLEECGQDPAIIKELECKCEELQNKVKEYEKYSEKCKCMEQECKELHEKLVYTEGFFQKDRTEMHKLITELTMVVKENKATILHMSQINKQQQDIIKTQSMALTTKEEQLSLIEKQSEDFKIKNIKLEQEVQNMKKTLSEPCSREACLCVSKELEDLRNALNVEKDTHLIKQKIIEDQSQTILNLQCQIKEKINELSIAQSDTMYLEDEIGKINEKLIKKHKELDKQVDEKESLIEKLRILECQKSQLSEEIGEFEEILQGFKQTCGQNQKQQGILKHLESEIKEQRQQWEVQKEAMAKEKSKAVCAAKFATQKLLDTVEDFQRQVDAHKKVQCLLTKMLHEKDEQLRYVTSKISNINSITKEIADPSDIDKSMKELFFWKNLEQLASSDITTNTSLYSSCSSYGKKSENKKRAPYSQSTKSCNSACAAKCTEPTQAFNCIHKIQEEPSRD